MYRKGIYYDLQVIGPDDTREDRQPLSWATVDWRGRIIYYYDEDAACAAQREYREQYGRDPMTGEREP